MNKDIRWLQRFTNFKKALSQLHRFIDKANELSELEKQGLIKSFEYTYELGWNTMKDFYAEQGETNLPGSRDTIRLAFRRGLITDGEGWMQVLRDRNETVHTYEEKIAEKIVSAIISNHYTLFVYFKDAMDQEATKN